MQKRGLFFNKRGITHQQLVFLVELVIPVIMLVILLGWVNDVTSNRAIDKNFIVRDVSLLTSVVHLNNYNMYYSYPLSEKMIFNFNQNSLQVSYEDDKFPVFYYFWKDQDITYKEQDAVIMDGPLRLLKDGNKFSHGEKVSLNLNNKRCSNIKTDKIDSIIIDPMNTLIGDDVLLDIANRLQNNIGNFISTKEVTRNSEFGRSIINVGNYETYIGLRYGSEENYLNVYYSINSKDYLKSQKLGCMIINGILGELNFTSVNLIAINPDEFSSDDQETLLFTDIGIIIEIGNINDVISFKTIEDESEFISRKISEAVKNYESE